MTYKGVNSTKWQGKMGARGAHAKQRESSFGTSAGRERWGARGAQAKLRESPFGAVTIVVVEGYMVEVRWSWDEGTVMAAGGARCTVEVHWSWDEGTVMAVKEHGARWKCAGAGMKGP